jgi:hypothetical protein
VEAYCCSKLEPCAHDDWKIHIPGFKLQGKTPPPLGSTARAVSKSSQNTPASFQGLGKTKGKLEAAPPPKRKFWDHKTVIYEASTGLRESRPDTKIYRGDNLELSNWSTSRSSIKS